MIPAHILWTKPFEENDWKLESCIYMFLSTTMAKEIYGEVHLITDEKGEELVHKTGLPYDKIYRELDQVTEGSTFTDAKVTAYRLLQDLLPGYLYLDYDVFITRPIAKNNIIVQCDEGTSMYTYQLYQYLIDQGIQFCNDYSVEDLRFLNMGLFRCVDKKIINDYYETYFTTIYQNKYLELDKAMIPQYKMFLEQNCIYKVLQEHNQLRNLHEHYPKSKRSYNDLVIYGELNDSPKILERYYTDKFTFEEGYVPPADINHIDKTGYTHLMHYKTQEYIKEDVVEYAFKRYPKRFSNFMLNLKHIC